MGLSKSGWLPNTLTFGNLFFGFSSMLAALRGRYDLAVLFIFASMLLDMFDGRVARMMKRDNALGKELDSFADLVSFGIAPGVIFYAAFLGKVPLYTQLWPDPGQVSNWIHLLVGAVSFVFPVCAALRLARFNTQQSRDEFIGLPSPVAGGAVVFLLAFSRVPGFFLGQGFLAPINFSLPYYVMIPLFFLLAVLMITRFRFGKPQRFFLDFRRLGVLPSVLFNLVILAALILFFKFFLLLVAVWYIGTSIVGSLLHPEQETRG